MGGGGGGGGGGCQGGEVCSVESAAQWGCTVLFECFRSMHSEALQSSRHVAICMSGPRSAISESTLLLTPSAPPTSKKE